MTNPTARFSQPQFLPLSLARAVWKHKLLVLSLSLVLGAAGVAVSRKLPAVYKAEALILVDPQKVPERFVTTTVTDDLQDRLATISQEIQTTPRLQGIVDELGLYRAARKTHDPDEVIEMMRKDIDIKVEKGRAFRISYQAPDPQVAARVVNRITALYIQQNLKIREIQAEGTTEFLDSQLQEAKKTLEKLEASLSRYKISHTGELPEQEGSISSALARLEVQLQGNQDATNRAQQDRIAQESSLNAALTTAAALKRASQVHTAVTSAGGVPVASDTALSDLEAQLAQLRERYTDDFPEVKRLKAKISASERARVKASLLSAKLQEQSSKEPAASETSTTAPPSAELLATEERIATLKSQLAATDRLIARETEERGRIITQISSNEQRVDQLPVREQEMASLTRDYQISKSNYQSLLDKKIAAEMAGDLEHRQKAERFRILDPAKAPDKPSKPNRPVLYIVSLLGGLLVGLAAAIGLELKKAVFLGEWELPKDIPVLAHIPEIEVAREKNGLGNLRLIQLDAAAGVSK